MKKTRIFVLHYLKSALLMRDVHVTGVIERDSQTAAERVEVSDVGWFPWL